MFDTAILVAVAATFLIAGTVKGVIGLGLPTVSLALLAVAMDLPHAMALMLVPSLLTNLWQTAAGGSGKAILRKLWPFLLMAAVTVWLGAMALTRVDLSLLSALLGALLVVYATTNLAGLQFTIKTRQEGWAGPLVGSVNGLLTVDLGTLSAAALLPALMGMALGQWIRQKLPEHLFRRVFFISLLMLGVYIIARASGVFI